MVRWRDNFISANGSRLGEVGDLKAQSLNFSTNFKYKYK